jgi:hypothetical protein
VGALGGAPGFRAGTVTRRPLLVFGLAFFALTLPLAWAWFAWGSELYTRLLLDLLDAVGVGLSRRGEGNPAAPRFISVVPFLVLMLVTPRLGWKRRLVGAAGGFAVLLAAHAGLLIVVDAAAAQYGPAESVQKVFPFVILADGVPLLLWMVLAREFLAEVIPGLGEGPPPAGGA